MPNQQFKVGDRVQFNIGTEKGPVGFGVVTRVGSNGSFIIQPQAGGVSNTTRFVNVRLVTVEK